MTKEEIIAAINKTFVDNLEIPEEELKPEAAIFSDLGLDSLDIVDLMIGLQRKFGISLRDNEEIRKIVTLNDLYNFFFKMQEEMKAKGIEINIKDITGSQKNQ